MATLPEIPIYPAGIYQLETTDPVMAGPGGIDNAQASELAQRTAWLRRELLTLPLANWRLEHAGDETYHAVAVNYDRAPEIVAVGSGTFNAVRRDKGRWTPFDIGGGSEHLQAVATRDGHWVAVGDAGGAACIFTSPDGTAWTQSGVTLGSMGWLTRVAAAPASDAVLGRWIATGNITGGAIYVSQDGATWTEETGLVHPESVLDLIRADGRWVVLQSSPRIQMSSDGYVWSTTELPPAWPYVIAHGHLGYVVSCASGWVGVSADAINWTWQQVPGLAGMIALEYCQPLGLYVGITALSYELVVSSDAVEWRHLRPRSDGEMSSIRGLAVEARGGSLLVCGDGSGVFQSLQSPMWDGQS